MMHGPCGLAYPSTPCTQNSTECKKHFPKEYCNRTYTDKDGFVHYQRRDTGATVLKEHVELDNHYVVPYNRDLLMTFYSHINVEYCRWTMIIKYLFKYISKGTDRIDARISRTKTNAEESTSRPHIVVDEIKNYLDSRHVSPHEVCWRILEFDIHHREPAVQILSIHLKNMQRVVFRDKDKLDSIVVNTHTKKTTLTKWLHYNEWNTDGRHLTYPNFPNEFVWNPTRKYWSRRQRHKSSIGRLTYMYPATGDLFYRRMLLCHQKGCTSFPDIRKVNDIVYPTCREACKALGLLEDDQEWENTMQEAACTATPTELRTLFAHILTFCQVTDPVSLWGRVLRSMSEDLPYTSSISLNIPNLHIYDSQLEDYMLYELEEGRILLAVSSSGVASLLLPAGRTAHSLFKLPLDLTDTSVCSIKKNTQLAKLIKETSLIIWDDALMNDRRCFETLDRTLRDILDIPNALFGANGNMGESEREKVTTFAKWLLDIEDGSLGNPDVSNPENTSWVDIPDNHRIPDDEKGMINLIRLIYDDDTLQNPTPRSYRKRRKIDSNREEQGKMILAEPEITNVEDLSSTDSNKIIEADGTPIQANMNVQDTRQAILAVCGLSVVLRLLEMPPCNANIKGLLKLKLKNEMATDFDMHTYNSLPKPVVIAVSSLWVSQYNGLQLSATSATHYYLDPNIPETYHIKRQHEQSTSTTPFLTINNQRYDNPNLEKTRNRFPLATLLEVDPQNYQAIVSDGSTTVSITCFSDQANSLTKDVHEVLAEISDKDPYHLPESLIQLEGTTHTFQFRFYTMSTSKRPVFVLDIVFPDIPLPLPAPPSQNPIQHAEAIIEPPHVQTLETMNPQPAPLSLPEPPPENSTNFPAIVPDPTPIQVGNLPSPALSTTASNELEITEAEIPTTTTPKTTPPIYNKEEHHQITDPKEYIPPQPPKTLT
ncbi:DNA helicase [Tanacetum coccineum]